MIVEIFVAKIVYIIPAYNPDVMLIEVVNNLRKISTDPILVINDGSKQSSTEIFSQIANVNNLVIIEHKVNRGKGQALKTAFSYVLASIPDAIGVVTLDADGQHRATDALRIGAGLSTNHEQIILGCRKLADRTKVPFKSWFGNMLSKNIFSLISGRPIDDTQTGLRGIPIKYLRDLLDIVYNRYEFEIEMLLFFVNKKIEIHEIEIETIYIENNKHSHFNPIVDSFRIYFVLFRFAISSVMTGLIDLFVFSIVYMATQHLAFAFVAGRVLAGIFNFYALKRVVFKSKNNAYIELSKYISLVLIILWLAHSIVNVLTSHLHLNVYYAKIIAESALFLLNFTVQRLFIFKRNNNQTATDWDDYYSKPFKATAITRSFTIARIIYCIQSSPIGTKSDLNILEFGGGNSCIYDEINKNIKPKSYTIVDNNRAGIDAFSKRHPAALNVNLFCESIFDFKADKAKIDLCISVGLIEHFDRIGTEAAINAHIDITGPEGVVIITFPTPTFLYKITRNLAEMFGLWKFHDERALDFDEVLRTLEKRTNILHQSIIWPIFLTQGIVVAQIKRAH